MKKFIVRFIREEEGQDVIEYALLGAFISIVAIVIIAAVGAGRESDLRGDSRRIGP